VIIVVYKNKKMGRILENVQINPFDNQDFKINYLESGEVRIFFKNLGSVFPDTLNSYTDNDYFIYGYAKQLVGLTNKNILFLGLGLGLMPFYLQNTNNNIAIIEKDQNLISIITSYGYLANNVNIYQGDIFDMRLELTLTNTFDYIVSDIHYSCDNTYYLEKDLIIDNYKDNLTTNGIIYFPVENFIYNK
jgi:spermidine synthase